MDVALPVVVRRPGQPAGAVELDERQGELAAVHPVLLNERPDLLSVVVGLADVRLASRSVCPLVPVLDAPLPLPGIEERRQRAAMLRGPFGFSPPDPESELG